LIQFDLKGKSFYTPSIKKEGGLISNNKMLNKGGLSDVL